MNLLTLALILFSLFLITGCAPVMEFFRFPEYKGENNFSYSTPDYDSSKATIILIADNEGTEIFDLLAPFYLFKLTHKANVYIVAEKKHPIIIRKGFFTLPHFTFQEFDSLNIKPSVMVIPALSPMDRKNQDPKVLKWINSHYRESTIILSVCAGSLTAAATELYDGKLMTTHSSEFKSTKKQYKAPIWVLDQAVTQTGNLYSTAGVSNAVEGSLKIINDLFGEEAMVSVMQEINYPHKKLKLEHKSLPLKLKDKLAIANKIYFKKNRKVGVFLHEGIDEFKLAAVLDTYHRSFPKSIKTFSTNNHPILSKHGLMIIPTGEFPEIKELDEMHILGSGNHFPYPEIINSENIVAYDSTDNQYIINTCLQRIESQYGKKFGQVVKRVLDYN
jgi:putative intracellular protease/amidase